MTPQAEKALRAADGLLRARRAEEAAHLLIQVVRAEPQVIEARLGLGQALFVLGDLTGAERELRAALDLDSRALAARAVLGEVLLANGRAAEGEAALRDVLALQPRWLPAAEALTRHLLDGRRAEEALAILTPLTEAEGDPALWSLRAEALWALGRTGESVEALRRIADRPGADPRAQHNLAAALVEARRFAEGQAAADRAIAAGFAAPETLRLRGQALQGQDRFDEAEAAYREALRGQGDSAAVHRDLAHLVWMRTEDVAAASEALDAAIIRHPVDARLRVVKAKLLEYAGDPEGGYATLTPLLECGAGDPSLEATAAQLSLGLDPERALRHAERALAFAPQDPALLTVAAEAGLAAGLPDLAEQRAEILRALAPHDQQALALLATAWRLRGDPRYAELHDYDRLVKTWRLDTPEGWSTFEAWLADLTRSLETLHGLKAHPVGQSLRQGSQTSQSLEQSTDPAIAGFFTAIAGPIQRHIDSLGRGADPLRSRSTGRFRISGSWSVKLRPGGRHVSHLHPGGWLSSAAYIALPDAIGTGREGWIGFGEPGVPTRPSLATEHWVKPEPGMLVLFPSYMWHGTEPFGGDQPRLTCAFDVVPV